MFQREGGGSAPCNTIYLSLSQKIKKMLVAQIRKKKHKERAEFFLGVRI